MRSAILRHVCLLMALFFVMAPAEAAKRVALVIGINSYSNLPADRQLKKAVNDARSIRDTLKTDLGFNDVFYEENADRLKMKDLIRQAEAHIERGDIVFIYFSGHGVSIGRGNYLLPSDVPRPVQGDEEHLIGSSFEAEALMRRMLQRGAQAVFSVLDACRDNPFVDERGKAVGAIGGLTTLDRAEGAFTLFAAGLGEIALDRLSEDDPDPNSVFTRNLIPLLKTSGLTQVTLAKEVQKLVAEVAAKIGHKQRPAYEDGILGFVTLKESEAKPPEQPRITSAFEEWQVVEKSRSKEVLEAFREKYKNDPIYSGLATEKLAALLPEKREKGENDHAITVDVGSSPQDNNSEWDIAAGTSGLEQNITSSQKGDFSISSPSRAITAWAQPDAAVKSALFSPDGKHIALAVGNRIVIRRVADGDIVTSLTGPTSLLYAIAYSGDGKQIAAGGLDGRITIWDTATGRVTLSVLGHKTFIESLSFSPDGKVLVSGSSNVAHLWDCSSGAALHSFEYPSYGSVTSILFSADGSELLLAYGSEISIYSIADYKLVRKILDPDAIFYAMDLSPDGRQLATGDIGGAVKLWDAASGRLVQAMGNLKVAVNSVAFSPDGMRLAFGSGDSTNYPDSKYFTAEIWDISSNRLVHKLQDHKDNVNSVRFSPDGARLASASEDGTVRIWNASSGKQVLALRGDVTSNDHVAFSTALDRVASTDGRSIAVWNANEGSRLFSMTNLGGLITGIAVSPNALQLATAISFDGKSDSGVRLWSLETPLLRRAFAREESHVEALAFAPAGNHLIVAWWNQGVSLWDTSSGKLVRRFGSLLGVADNSLAFSSDGSLVANFNGHLIDLYDAKTGATISQLKVEVASGGLSVAFSSDGSLLAAGSEDGKIRILDVKGWRVVSEFVSTSGKRITSVAFSPDGNSLASAADGRIEFWSLNDRKLARTISSKEALSVVFSADGGYLVGAGGFEGIGFYDAKSGNEIARFLSLNGNEWVAYASNGHYAGSPGCERYLRIMDENGAYVKLDEAYQSTHYHADGLGKLMAIAAK